MTALVIIGWGLALFGLGFGAGHMAANHTDLLHRQRARALFESWRERR
jgi:hypothetical protein